jgi:putative membrane protein
MKGKILQKFGLAAAIGGLALCSGMATMAQDAEKPTAANQMAQGSSDATFAKHAAQGGMAEVKMGQLAQDKGSSDSVKMFGQRMVQDHSAANDKLKSVAAQESITLPTRLSAKDQATYDRLSKLSGHAFDRAYAQDMVQDHVNDIAEFKKEAANGTDSAIKGFATETLPTLQDHLKMARQMLHTVSPSSAAAGGH